MTATTARIRRCNRDSEFAVAQDTALLAARPDAKPTGSDSFVIDSFFDVTAHAQKLLDQRFGVLSSPARRSVAAESSEPLSIGIDVPIVPKLPAARMIDRTSALDRTMPVNGLAVDFDSERNSIEVVG